MSGTKAEQDALEQVAAYHRELQLCLREQETKFDNAVLFVAGGAFTISAAFISDLDPPLSAAIALGVGWLSWALCLLVGVGGYLVGARATRQVIEYLDAGVYDANVLKGVKALKYIAPINRATYVLLILGFVGFGWFTIANLQFGGRRSNEETQVDKEEGRQQETGGRADEGAQRPVAGSTMAAPQENIPQVRQIDGRQETPTTAAAATATAAAPNSEVRSGPADAGKADGSHGAVPAARMAPAD